MTTPEEKFVHDLEIFRTEATSGLKFYFTWLSIQYVIGENKKALNKLNENSIFWGTNISALQISAFITLGRVFDNNSKHNISKLLEFADKNREIFSKHSLAARKRKDSSNADDWLPEYLKNAYVPTNADFKRLKTNVEKYQNIYDKNYRKIRNRIYAHKEISEKEKIKDLFKRTTIRELELIFVFLIKFYYALWELLVNGKKPLLKPLPYSIRRLINKKTPGWEGHSLQKLIVGDAHSFFDKLMREA